MPTDTPSGRPLVDAWPDVFLVGAPRSGTTSLFTLLKQHPDIYVSVLKEPHFFGRDLTCQPHSVRDRAVYRALFEGAEPGQLRAEGSVWYLRSATAAAEIAAVRPDARILIMLRDPVEMVRSLHALYLRTGNEDRARLDDALDAEPARRRGGSLPEGAYFPEGLLYSESARYHDGVARFIAAFGAEQVLVTLFDDFVVDPSGTYGRVLRFLGRAPFEPEWDLAVANQRMRPSTIHALRRLRRRAPALVREMRRGGQTHLGSKPPCSVSTRRRLAALFADDVARTAALIDRDLSHWCGVDARNVKDAADERPSIGGDR